MIVENKGSPSQRHGLIVLVMGIIGLTTGALGGYLTYSYAVIFRVPIINLKGSSNDSPFEQTFRGMARLGGLESAAGRCDGKPVSAETIERETQVIDQIETASKSANLDPPLNVARAIVAYRNAKIASVRSDNAASDKAIEQGVMFLRAAGWKDASPDELEAVVHESENCQVQDGMPKEKH